MKKQMNIALLLDLQGSLNCVVGDIEGGQLNLPTSNNCSHNKEMDPVMLQKATIRYKDFANDVKKGDIDSDR